MLIATVLAASLLVDPGYQETPPSSTVDDVVVSARKLEEQVESFVRDVTVPDTNLNVARWHRDMCVSVVNMQNDVAQNIIDRVAEVALEVGVKSGGAGCDANVTIIATANASETTEQLAERYRYTFLPDVGGAHRTREAFDRFKQSDLPVRWWHTSMPIDPNTGHAVGKIQNNHITGDVSSTGDTRDAQIIDFPIVYVTSSLLRSGIRSDLSSAVIILDMEKLAGISVPQIADYISMIALTRVNMDADYTGYDSILALMTDKSTPGLSDWDMAYLKSLYGGDLTHKRKSQQMNELKFLMAEWEIRRPLRREQHVESDAAAATENPR